MTLETPHPVPRSSIAALARGLVEGQNLVLIADSAGDMYRVEPNPPPPVKASPSQGEGADATAQSSAPQFFVIHLHHARAAISAATINALYGRASALGESSLRGSGSLNQAMVSNQLQAAATPSAGAPAQTASSAAVFTGETSIVPDQAQWS